jgi:hypothetical protein
VVINHPRADKPQTLNHEEPSLSHSLIPRTFKCNPSATESKVCFCYLLLFSRLWNAAHNIQSLQQAEDACLSLLVISEQQRRRPCLLLYRRQPQNIYYLTTNSRYVRGVRCLCLSKRRCAAKLR